MGITRKEFSVNRLPVWPNYSIGERVVSGQRTIGINTYVVKTSREKALDLVYGTQFVQSRLITDGKSIDELKEELIEGVTADIGRFEKDGVYSDVKNSFGQPLFAMLAVFFMDSVKAHRRVSRIKDDKVISIKAETIDRPYISPEYL